MLLLGDLEVGFDLLSGLWMCYFDAGDQALGLMQLAFAVSLDKGLVLVFLP